MGQRALIVGGGLAGSEAAWQLLRFGIEVELIEARPAVSSPAHHTLLLGELVCSNSLRSDAPDTAPGLLKEELRTLGSLILRSADATRVPAGSALAVDRRIFSWHITSALLGQRQFRLNRYAIECLPEKSAILATGPLTSRPLTTHLQQLFGPGLYFYDAIAPIISADAIDWEIVFRGARRDPEGKDYVNCPLNRDQYDQLVQALRSSSRVAPHSFEEPRYFEGCLPVEVMAARGDDVLAHGPLRPVGLLDPRTGKRPYAVVQLRAENEDQTSYNLVGFQTRLTQPEQRRVFRLIPGLAQAHFLRYGAIHRNSFIDSPRLLADNLELKNAPHIRIAGQLSGVEGYLESTAMGLLSGLFVAAEIKGRVLPPVPRTTAIGSLLNHVTRPRAASERFEPSNITFGLLPAYEGRQRDKRQRRIEIRERALRDLAPWWDEIHQILKE